MATANKSVHEQEISYLKNLINDKDLNIQPKTDLNVIELVCSFKPFLEKYKKNQRIQGNIDVCYKQLGRYKDIIYDLNKYEEYLLYSDIENIDLSLFFKYIYKLEDISENLQQTQQEGTEKSDIDVHDIIEKAEQRLLNSIFKYYLGMVKPFNPKVFIQRNQIFPSILDDSTCLDNIMQIIEFYSSQDKLVDILRAYINERQSFLKGCLSYISMSNIKDNEEMKVAIDSVSSFISLESYLIKDLNFASYLEEQHEDQGEYSNGAPVLTSYAVFQQVVSAMCAKVLSKVKSEINSASNDGLNVFVLANKMTELTDSLVALDKEHHTHTVIVDQFMNQQSTLNKLCLTKLSGLIADIPRDTAMTKLPSDFGMNAKTVELFSRLKQSIDDNRNDVVKYMAHTEINMKNWLPSGEKGADVPPDVNTSSSKIKYQMFLLDFLTITFNHLEKRCLKILASGKKVDYPQYFKSNYNEVLSESSTLPNSIPADEQTCISGIFLSIHVRVLEQLLPTNSDTSIDLFTQKVHKLDKKYTDMCLVSWKKLIQPMMPLINNSSMKTTDSNFKKNKEVAKEKFNRFNANFEALLANWTLNLKPLVKDKTLKKKLKKDIKMIVEPMYKLLYDKYSKGWFKNQEKYVKFDTRELSRKLDNL
ncbi:uncharacterized protein HGUI_03614 [Hanseniaspora guilliermondii]|uniref:Exocyst complex subunit Exo70 C-terminal domain-containing protein n=1 Tax=Hanseniaspora guilliermondii TaxID=56406 RepID=A0A1L0CQX9_9ASCO|nr:uncharacterized protein HGUI_03614 [Hanseniaspora guilliermondii]